MPDQEPLQPLDYAAPSPRRRRVSVAWLLIVLAILAVGTFLFGAFQPRPITTRAVSNRAICQVHMRHIGRAIVLYQTSHAGSYPDSLTELLGGPLTAYDFICPESDDEASSGATTQAIAADFHLGGHLSYLYIGKGLDDKTATCNTVVLYEPLTNHGGSGMNILFGDGHVEWFNATISQQVITAAATGQRVKIIADVVSTVPIASTQPKAK